MVVGAAHQDFSPWLRVRGRHTVTICKHVDLLWCQLLEKSLCQIAQKRVAQTVDPLKMFEKKDELLEVHGLELPFTLYKRMRDSVRDLCVLKVPLQIEDVFANAFDIAMLLFRNPPDQNVQLAGVVRKISSNLLADEGPRQVRNFQAAIDRIVIGNGNVIHPAFAQLLHTTALDRNSCRENRSGGKAILPSAHYGANGYVNRTCSPYIPRFNRCSAIQS